METQRPILSGRHLIGNRLGAGHLVSYAAAASAPLTVVAGGIVVTYAEAGVSGVPLSFLLLAPVLLLFTVGYAAMSRHVTSAGGFGTYAANGLGRTAGVPASFVAILAYNCIQIGLYGLLGSSLADFVRRETGLDWPWWTWAFAAMLVIAVLGAAGRADLGARLLAVALAAEVAVIVAFAVAALAHPAGHSRSLAGFAPGKLFTGAAAGAVLSLSIAAFTGFESGVSYGEETRDPRRSVARATYITVLGTGALYTVGAWALALATGPTQVVGAARRSGPDLLFDLGRIQLAGWYATLANIVFLTSQFSAMLSFHAVLARYFYACGREGTLPGWMSRTSAAGVPVIGSVTQTLLAAGTVSGFAVAGRDPVAALFTWLSEVGAAGLVLLMATVSVAVICFFARHPRGETLWARAVAPGLAAVTLGGLFVLILANFPTLLGTAASSPLRWQLPGLLVLAAGAGLARALYLRATRGTVYALIGRTDAVTNPASL